MSVRDVLPWVADALVVLALAVMTIGVYGLRRMPDVYTQLHATSKAVFLGVIAILVASMATLEPAVITRVALITVFLVLTTPVAAHAIALAAYRLREPMRTPGAIDESGRGLAGAARDEERRRRAAGVEPGWRVVVGYDGSEQANRALERVAMLAGEDAAITVVTAGAILPESPVAPDRAVVEEGEERQRVLEEGRARLAELGLRAEAVEAFGDPADALMDVAREIGADLIVVGTRGRTVTTRVLLGSVSAKIASQAPCDVLVVR